ncbi:MAG: glycosyltransferase family 4 protein [Bacteroidales bacterium]|nr:glycosyltransferase family 4 protein [Bacteroidales bacterium]
MINIFHIVSNKIWSGPEQYAYDLMLKLKDRDDYYVEMVCGKSDAVLSRFRPLEIPLSILPLKGITDLDSPKRFKRLLKRGQCIIHVHSFGDAVTAILAKHMSSNSKNVRIVLSLHGVERPRLNMASKMVYRELDRVVFASQKAYDSFMPRIKKFDAEKAVIIRDSVLKAHIDTSAPSLREQLGIAPEKALIMYHGRLSHEKGVDTLIKALSQIDRSTYHLVLVGEGHHKFMAKIKGFIVANQMLGNVSFLGFSPCVQSLVNQCDFGVLPSIVPEALGLSNLEYMMHAKAHIATNNGAQLEYLTHGENALLVDPDNQFQLADAIQRLITDTTLRNTIAQQAKKDHDDHLGYDPFYTKITEMYKTLF